MADSRSWGVSGVGRPRGLDLDDPRVRAVLHVLGIDAGTARRAFARGPGAASGPAGAVSRVPEMVRVRRLVVMALRLARFGGVETSYPEIARLCGLTHSSVYQAIHGRCGSSITHAGGAA